MQALAHLGAAMVDLNASVAVDQNQCASLIEERRGKGNAELNRCDRESALAMHARAVEAVDFLAPSVEIARVFHLSPDGLDAAGILHGLAVMRRVTVAIKILLTNQFG